MSATVENRVALWVSSHPGHTSSEIALAVRARLQTVREVLASPVFVAADGPKGSTVFALSGASGKAGTGATGLTHKQRVLRLLSDGQPHSHHELYGLHVIAHSRVADLRHDGYRIEQWREGDLYIYRLLLDETPDRVAPRNSPAGVSSSSHTIPSADSGGGAAQLALTGPAFRKQAAA